MKLDTKNLHKDLYGKGQEILCPFCNKPSVFYEYLDKPGYRMGYECKKCKKAFSQFDVGVNIYNRFVYKEKCSKCKNWVFVTTQKDDNPEYYTHIGVVCKCGNLVNFSLPVN